MKAINATVIPARIIGVVAPTVDAHSPNGERSGQTFSLRSGRTDDTMLLSRCGQQGVAEWRQR